jgi:Glycosyltransferase
VAKPLTIYTVWPPKATASFYYRIGVPVSTAQDLGLNVRSIIDQNLVDVSPMDRIRNFCESDLIILYQPVGESVIQQIRGVQSFLVSRRDDGWKWPPSVMLETDDNLFNVSPLNQAFKNLGIRDMNGTMIPPGHHIGVISNGEKKVLWRDGEADFSILRNRQTLGTWKSLLEMADAVGCSTPAVAKAIEKEANVKRVKIHPNLVRFDHYEQVDLKETDKIKILWQGGIAHYEDFYPLREAFGNVTRKYPEVHWIIWGAQFPWVKELIPAHRYTFKDWCPYPEYKLRLAMVGHDIAIAPLQENVFNTCRSAIKWYEASVLKKPAATLAQNSGAYQHEIQDGETALLFNDPQEFEDKLGLLIENAKLRKTLASNAKDWLSENRDAMKEVPKLVSFWEQLREDRKKEQPHVSDEQWAEIEAEARAEEASTNGVLQPA